MKIRVDFDIVMDNSWITIMREIRNEVKSVEF
jgi:hypothetical protein